MINAAVIEENMVANVIYIDQENMDAFIASGMELMDSAPLGLTIGDYREGDTWYRDIDGVKTELPIVIEPEPSEATDMLNALTYLGVEPEEANG